ncbi:MAG: hypothetical protein WC509_02140 [Candidatus Izemoplasmatales bacterium]
MLVDLFRGLAIVLKFLFWDLWVAIFNFLFRKQNPKLKDTYYRRVASKRRM